MSSHSFDVGRLVEWVLPNMNAVRFSREARERRPVRAAYTGAYARPSTAKTRNRLKNG